MCFIFSNNDIYIDINKEKFKWFFFLIVVVCDINVCLMKYE